MRAEKIHIDRVFALRLNRRTVRLILFMIMITHDDFITALSVPLNEMKSV